MRDEFTFYVYINLEYAQNRKDIHIMTTVRYKLKVISEEKGISVHKRVQFLHSFPSQIWLI